MKKDQNKMMSTDKTKVLTKVLECVSECVVPGFGTFLPGEKVRGDVAEYLSGNPYFKESKEAE
jgi:hypothetical protein